MSKIFYDHLIVLEEVEDEITSSSKTHEEREELWGIVDDIIHHRVLGKILDHLPSEHHEDFMDRFHKKPHDERLIDYLNEKIEENVEEIIKQEIGNLAFELLQEIRGQQSKR